MLQDNGRDDLTLSGDGPFTFGATLANGAAYNVTVKTQPGGQTCKVSNASGTVSSASVTDVAVNCSPGADDFDRPDSGGLGAGWAAMTDGGLAISGGHAVGTSSNGYSGNFRVAESYGSDQYSQIVLTSNQLTTGQWIGPTVRSQNGGLDTYLGIYFWSDAGPQLDLYKRSGGAWTQLGNSYPVAPLPAGTVLTLVAIGSKISFLENGTERITVTDNSLTGGDPGLMTYGTPGAASWIGDDATATNPAI
ncbi:MAG TPA: hypothetical protein VGI50_07250, partial [Solirubrobacteraceae bacterium]